MRVSIAIVGDENDAYPSHREINAVRSMLGEGVDTEWVATDGDRVRDLQGFHGIWLTPGSPYADDAAAYDAVKWARERDVPFLGTCGGLQYAVVEYFRNVLGDASASHAESDGVDDTNVVRALACSLDGEERMVRPLAGTRFSRLVNNEPFVGMTEFAPPGTGAPAALVARAHARPLELIGSAGGRRPRSTIVPAGG
jgi:CTP synthase (UTP-ammonia lyase)